MWHRRSGFKGVLGQQKDTLFADQDALPFTFDAEVSRVFADMIARSVPGYALTLQMIAVIAGLYAQKGSRLYDLGCSLGASTLAMAHGVKVEDCVIVGVDNSQSMLDSCQKNVAQSPVAVDLLHQDIEDVIIKDASIVVLNFTLQFIAKEKRDALLQHIFKGMRQGGVLILSEKVMFEADFVQKEHIKLHESFKKAQGYTDLEVSRKRQSLENVLLSESLDEHHQRLLAAGFSQSQTWFQCFNFVSMLAYKV
ncbi:MAG: carboxy-S-adenosyl-L-methionine synthase CmoA [Ghiorsea sp.]